MFKVGDLIQMDNQFCSTRHPPMGTYGIVVDVEDWDDPTILYDSNSSANVMVDVDQFIRVHWAHHKNGVDQCYMNTSLKKVEA